LVGLEAAYFEEGVDRYCERFNLCGS
jgi:hypothetical protein